MNDDPLEGFHDLPIEQQEEVRAQTEVVGAAWEFLTPFYGGDLAAAWLRVHPSLQLCWSQWWAHANETPMAQAGLVAKDVAQNVATAGPEAEEWTGFARVILRDFRQAWPLDPDVAGIGAAPRVIAPDIELLMVHPEAPEGNVWQPGHAAEVMPLVMAFDAGVGWRVLNFASDLMPEPGWPPRM
jgi:hypothetical protein